MIDGDKGYRLDCCLKLPNPFLAPLLLSLVFLIRLFQQPFILRPSIVLLVFLDFVVIDLQTIFKLAVPFLGSVDLVFEIAYL